jgi:hypothetical protein
MPNWTIARYADPVEMRATDIAPVRTSLRERRVGTVVTGNVRSAEATGSLLGRGLSVTASATVRVRRSSGDHEDIGQVLQPGTVRRSAVADMRPVQDVDATSTKGFR